MLFVLLALAWVPITMHCKMEVVPGFEFLGCNTNTSESPLANNHCDGNCCSVEAGNYQASSSSQSAPILFAVILPEPVKALDVEASLPREVSLGVLTAAPPELSVIWQFISRTALPVRAPSLV